MNKKLEIIARIHTDFSTKFGIPRQSGIVEELEAVIIFEPNFRNYESIRGLEDFSHIWLIWQFSELLSHTWSPTVRPPRLGGNTRMGVFATRSPFRPNPLGLSCVKLSNITFDKKLGPLLHVRGADLMDNTPIFDIKPYLPYTDSKPEATGGFSTPLQAYQLKVNFDNKLLNLIPADKQSALLAVLAQDPRPAYQDNPERMYGFTFSGFDIHFKVSENILTVYEVVEK